MAKGYQTYVMLLVPIDLVIVTPLDELAICPDMLLTSKILRKGSSLVVQVSGWRLFVSRLWSSILFRSQVRGIPVATLLLRSDLSWCASHLVDIRHDHVTIESQEGWAHGDSIPAIVPENTLFVQRMYF